MNLSVVEEDGIKVVEGLPDQELMSNVADTSRVIEACLSGGVRSERLERLATARRG